MSITVDMMPSDVEPGLAQRLALLTGEDPACCVADLQEDADAARAATGFEATLLRAKALSDEKRLLACLLLQRRQELCACEVQAALDLKHATVSHHMSTLQKAGLVEAERRGKWVHYRLAPGAERHLPQLEVNQE